MKKHVVLTFLIVALGVLLYFGVFKNYGGTPKATPTPSPSKTIPPPLTPFPSSPTGFRGPTGLTERGSCILSGKIRFLEKNLFASEDAKVTYKNIDSEARLIKWAISPSDDLSPGPNLFNNMDIPDGERSITVRLPENPRAKRYTLTASVTYGEYKDGNVEVKETRCSGYVLVTLEY